MAYVQSKLHNLHVEMQCTSSVKEYKEYTECAADRKLWKGYYAGTSFEIYSKYMEALIRRHPDGCTEKGASWKDLRLPYYKREWDGKDSDGNQLVDFSNQSDDDDDDPLGDDRDRVTHRFGWCVVTPPTLLEIKGKLDSVGVKKMLSVNCGRGNVESALSDIGLQVIMTDIWKRSPSAIEMDSVAAATKYCQECECICSIWPPGYKSVLYDALVASAKKGFPFQYVLYMGEDCAGCTGGYQMYELMDVAYEEIASFPVFKWRYIHDKVHLYRLTDSTEILKYSSLEDQ